MWRLPVAVAFLAVVASDAMSAQTIRGTLRVSDEDAAAVNARVWLVNRRGVTVDTTRSRDLGRFELKAPFAGEFRVVVRRIGYTPEHTDYIRLREGEVREEVINLLSVRVLPTVEVSVSRDTRRLFGINTNSLGRSQFLRPEQVDRLRPFSLDMTDLLRHANIASVQVRDLGGGDTCVQVRSFLGGCAAIYLDGLWLGDVLPPLGAMEIESFLVLRPNDSVLVPGGGALMIFTGR
ncbi:MAG: hypothetical protein MNPFHGCM_02326 [Gemmatimonadaceae bacterium]|nr:hypothetical protein [Gemmatimonadaceae bacterium]